MPKSITDITPIPSAGTGAVLLTPTDLGAGVGADSAATSRPALGQAMGAGTSASAGSSTGRERIQRFAGMLHRAIDSTAQKLGSKSQGVMSAQAKYGEQAQQYGETARQRINAQPLQSVGIALGAGIVFSKLFLRGSKEKVRIVEVPVVRSTPAWDAGQMADRRARSWMDAASARLHGLAATGHEAVGKTKATAGLGLLGTRAMGSALASKASTLPLQMRLATERLLGRSQAYAGMARSGVQAHPLVGAGTALAAVALLATAWLKRRSSVAPTAYVTVDDKGHGVAWQHDRPDGQTGALGMIAARPVTSAAAVLGVGTLIAALLMRR